MTHTRPLRRGDVVLVSFPFTDLSGRKVRPALIVGRPSGSDLIVAFITSQFPSGTTAPVSQAEYLLDLTDPEFPITGLKSSSVVRLDKLATLDRRIVHRRLGRVGVGTAHGIATCLRYVFEL